MGTGKQRKEGPFSLKERSMGFGHQLDAGRKGDGRIELGSRSSGTDTRGWCLPNQRERCQMLNQRSGKTPRRILLGVIQKSQTLRVTESCKESQSSACGAGHCQGAGRSRRSQGREQTRKSLRRRRRTKGRRELHDSTKCPGNQSQWTQEKIHWTR